MLPRKRRLRSLRLLAHGLRILTLGTLLLILGCDGLSGEGPVEEVSPRTSTTASHGSIEKMSTSENMSEVRKGLATFRRATARYHRVETARAEGFEQILPCLSNPDGPGAIGIPFANLSRFDGTIDLNEPEILFYEPQSNGSLRLVGGEPVVPVSLWPGTDPPSLFGHEFHRNEEHGLFGLHMWVWRTSSDGVFSFWNENVSCQAVE